MIVDQFHLMAAYNAQINRQFYAACAGLDKAEREADRSAFFGSIHGTLNHLLLVDRLWLGGFTGNRVAFGALDHELYGDFGELRRERVQTDSDICEWVGTLSPETLAAPFNESLRFPLWLTVTHFFNHQTHHRGQLSALLSQCGLDYGVTDIPWVQGIDKPQVPLP